MKDNNKKPYDRIRWLLNILMTQVIICLFLGEFLYARDNKVNQEKTKIFDREWIVTGENGIKTNITLPGKCEAQEGEWVSIETKLPDDQEDTWCYIRSSFQDYRIYVDDELRTEYSTKGISLLGKNSASAFVFFELYHTDAGKTLRLEHTSISDYAGYFHQVYTGERTDLIHDLIQSYGFVTFFPVFMLLMGILVIIYGIVTRFVRPFVRNI